jgi:lytic amidase (N-acetylmuramoyl-L-alanine amidase)
MDIDTSRYREGLPQIGYAPYHQVHAHSTGNKNSTAQNEADYHMRRPVESGFFSHVVGNGRVMQVGPVNNGAYDVGGGWNYETYAAVELIESHSTEEEFMEDYRLYIELLRNLADEAGLPKTLDSDDLEGIKSHEYCTNNQPNNFSDHVDPYPYLASWGISREQFKHDIENGLEIKKGWQKNDTGFWYVRSDGTYPKDQFEKIDGSWYYFDGSGYMFSDKWKKRPDGTWYYFDKSGEMATGWKLISNKWYYFKDDGEMVTGWVKYQDTWYYLDGKEGSMVSNAFVKSEKGWYYLKEDGSLADKPEFTVEPDGLITTK